ncbi:hypothetical protein San01_42100 [Streptomyces angustmyceticus]|uniref:Uncharacterized protein n=1 Tax=Streptomyces angustmyceticus TaxID=285578 RepID=A0A5J4LC25_9ACTN|nr:hypothetical protein San01_42100 [Streptomyces angustmyceticus]
MVFRGPGERDMREFHPGGRSAESPLPIARRAVIAPHISAPPPGGKARIPAAPGNSGPVRPAAPVGTGIYLTE